MVTKLSKVIAAWRAGKKEEALRIAAKFPRLGEHAAVIQRGWAAFQNPEFYKELGHDPEELFNDAIRAIKERYNLP